MTIIFMCFVCLTFEDVTQDWEVSLSNLTTIRELMAYIDQERGIPVAFDH